MRRFIQAVWLAKNNDMMLCFFDAEPYFVWHVLTYSEYKESRRHYSIVIDFKKGKVKYIDV